MLKEGMMSAYKLMVVQAFGNHTGEVQGHLVKSFCDEMKTQQDKATGAAEAHAKARAAAAQAGFGLDGQ